MERPRPIRAEFLPNRAGDVAFTLDCALWDLAEARERLAEIAQIVEEASVDSNGERLPIGYEPRTDLYTRIHGLAKGTVKP